MNRLFWQGATSEQQRGDPRRSLFSLALPAPRRRSLWPFGRRKAPR
jgi:hypothetical protein